MRATTLRHTPPPSRRAARRLIKTLPHLVNLSIFTLLLLIIFALLGKEMLGGAFDEAHGYGPGLLEKPRFHFDYFPPAMITCFILMTGTSWYDGMVEAMGVAGHGIALFFIVVLIIGC